ncbi:MAG: hypothetical protein NTW32_26220 [Chloroflexi bacterium]|nr:hypothetical protein [Chloroflexota bacterium]
MDTFQAIKELTERYKKIQGNALGLDHSRSEQYRSQLTALVSQYKRVRPKKPPVLTIPVIFGRKHNENFLSHYLAYILNPQQNGIGTAPLEAVLKLCKINLLGFRVHLLSSTKAKTDVFAKTQMDRQIYKFQTALRGC